MMQKAIINGYLRRVDDEDDCSYYIFIYSSTSRPIKLGTTHNKKEACDIASDLAKHASQLQDTNVTWITVDRANEHLETIARWTILNGRVKQEGEI